MADGVVMILSDQSASVHLSDMLYSGRDEVDADCLDMGVTSISASCTIFLRTI